MPLLVFVLCVIEPSGLVVDVVDPSFALVDWSPFSQMVMARFRSSVRTISR